MQFPALLGERGLLPVPEFTQAVPFSESPGLFHFRYSDRLLRIVAAAGIAISTLLFVGATEQMAWWLSPICWLAVYVLYLSIVNVGQRFYSFGWESMLLEAGFFAAFIGPSYMVVPAVPILILRWMLFRVEFGAGLIKIRHDKCWRDLTCLYYHHETQPLPNPISYYFHLIPKMVLRGGVAFSHLVQIALPFGLFAPQPVAAICAGFIIFHQLLLIVSGNYAWLNWLTVVLAITGFTDTTLGASAATFLPHAMPYPIWHGDLMGVLLAVVVFLSIAPTLNLFSPNQLMNYSYNPLHLVNTYGAFGSISKQRFEVVMEGTRDAVVNADTKWLEYEFKAKPGSLTRRPPQVAPYHLRLDWLMWFLPLGVTVAERNLLLLGYDLWFLRFVQKLLQNDAQTAALLKSNPFADGTPPAIIRARYYLYEFTSPEEHKNSGAWWKRTLIADYMPPTRLNDLNRALNRSVSMPH